jgi:hypothetical protein
MGFEERLRVPGRWWLYAGAVVLAVLLAAAGALGPGPGLLAAAGAAGALAGWLSVLSSTRVTVDADGLRVGPAQLPAWAIGPAEALDRDQVRLARGAGADPRGFYPVRGYVPTAVRVGVDDPTDPVPFWLVSTRHPDALARALATARESAGPQP